MSTLHRTLIRFDQHGDPSVLSLHHDELAAPGAGELRIVQHAIGLNYADVYQRQGAAGPHQDTAFPVIPGSQGAGLVEAVGAGVTDFKVGQAVTYLYPGAYASARLVPAQRALPIPEGLTMETAAALLLRGMTAEYLLHRLYPVQPGDRLLVHAAAGGMGQLLAAWGRALGAEVIGTVGSPEKAEIARQCGCHHVIDYRREDFVARVQQITAGEGVHVVYDAVGKDVFVPSLDCLRPRGMAINYGTASGDVQGFDLQRLHARSLTVCRPTLRTFVDTPEALRRSAEMFAAAVRRGDVPARIARRYPLAQARQAHEDLESRRTTGAAVLLP
ncbi:quinone oxidoreductase family protein [Alloalcanivorax mobilis]|uniref:quinone oxidoreductase family protein n=1 Tax=Alloalcanivorax mobilis TaxID=2019569 RepID=UPI0018E4D7C8|nr:quinone oxidoreductase [Alloalcanivorax mobilis]